MPSLRDLIEAECAAVLEDTNARAALQEVDAEATRRLAPTIDADGERFKTLIQAALFADATVLDARALHLHAMDALARARAAVAVAQAELQERNVVAQERQTAAFEAAEARHARLDAEAETWARGEIATRIVPRTPGTTEADRQLE